jgi:hypothetical protein
MDLIFLPSSCLQKHRRGRQYDFISTLLFKQNELYIYIIIIIYKYIVFCTCCSFFPLAIRGFFLAFSSSIELNNELFIYYIIYIHLFFPPFIFLGNSPFIYNSRHSHSLLLIGDWRHDFFC